ncbi:MAG: ABC transporter ATP-binding protein [Gammaproteobacteria bacterium]|nr:ABC transporter ATP-binding protein [Gammaproteobacteria bacterium]
MSLPVLFAGPRRGMLLRLLLNGFAQALLVIALALLVERLFDAILAVETPLPISSALLLAATVVAGALLRQRERVDAERLGQHFVNDVRGRLFGHLGELPPRTVAARDPGGLMLRFVGDLNAWRQWVSLGIARGVVGGLLLAGILVALAVLHWAFALGVLVLVAVVALAGRHLAGPLVRAVRDARRRRARLAGNVGEKLHSLEVVQLFDRRQAERRRLSRQGRRLGEAMVRRASWIGWLRALAELLGGLATLLVLLIGAWLVRGGDLEPTAVAAALGAASMLLPLARDFARVHEYRQGARVAREKAESFLALQPVAPPRDEVTLNRRRQRGRLVFDAVRVAGVLDDVTVEAPAGERVVLCGANGSGKSTLLALAARLLEPDRGRVTVDGIAIGRMTRPSLRRAVGLARADLPLLRGTVLANIRYGMRERDASAMDEVSRLCGLDALAEQLPRGLESRIRDHGRNLSLGQRQRIVLARALLLRPRVLLLDEMGANFDRTHRDLLVRLLAEYPGTVIYVTHDPGLQALAGRAWHLEQGRLTVTRDLPRAPAAQLGVSAS